MKTLFFVLVLLSASASLAAGTNIDLHSARATAMATAVVANSPDPSAIYFNPAEMVEGGESFRIQVGDTLLLPAISFQPAGNPKVYKITNPAPPFTLYATWGVTRDLTVGIGVFEPFGLAVDWPDDFPGRFIAKHSTLRTYYVNPQVAYRFGVVKVGAGVQIVRATVDLLQSLDFGTGTEGSAELAAGSWGVGGNAGIQADLIPDLLSVGASYRSRVKLSFTGHVHFDNVPVEFQGSQPGQLHDQNASTALWQPDEVAVGFSLRPLPPLRLNFEADYYAWQLFSTLRLEFDDPALSRTERKNWTHGINYHLGAEYQATPELALRAGYMYDPTPSPMDTLIPDVPDSTRMNFGLGLGYRVSAFTVDLGYQFIKFTGASTSFPPNPLPGRYDGVVNAFSLSVGYQR